MIPRLGEINAVLFDMDGLLFDSEVLYKASLEKMAEARGKAFTREIHKSMMGRSAHESIEVLKTAWELEENVEELLKERDNGVIELAKDSLKIMPGVIELLTFCVNREVKHAIVTGSTRDIATAFIQNAKIPNNFAFILTGNDVEHGKPAPDIYLEGANRIQEEAKNCLVFEDSVNGVVAAKAAGCKVIACPNAYSNRKDFGKADYVVGSLAEITPLLSMI